MCSVKPNSRSRSFARRAFFRAPTFSPQRKNIRPMKQAMEERAEEVTAAVRFCSCVHLGEKKKHREASRCRWCLPVRGVPCAMGALVRAEEEEHAAREEKDVRE